MDQSLLRRLMIAIGVGASLSMALAVVLIVWHDASVRAVGEQAYTTLLQFLLVAVLGGGVSVMYQAFNREADRRTERLRREQERAEALRETRQRYSGELVAQYNIVKRARRLLRATALTAGPELLNRRVRLARYDELMLTVLDAQLALETMSRTVGAAGGPFEQEHDLADNLCRAEGYLRSLITEYEEIMPRAEHGDVAVREMPELAALVGPYAEGVRFRDEFVHAVQTALADLDRLIVGPALR